MGGEKKDPAADIDAQPVSQRLVKGRARWRGAP